MVYRLLIICFALFACQMKDTESVNNDAKVEYNLESHVEYYPNGVKRMEGKLLNGDRHGLWVVYHENGMKWSEGKFKYGVRQGTARVYYENGKKKIEGEYVDGLKVGVWTVWGDDGIIAGKINLDEKISPSDSLNLEIVK